MIEMLEAMLAQAEEDIRRLEADSAQEAQSRPVPRGEPGPTLQS
jgi:hypothetical protein